MMAAIVRQAFAEVKVVVAKDLVKLSTVAHADAAGGCGKGPSGMQLH